MITRLLQLQADPNCCIVEGWSTLGTITFMLSLSHRLFGSRAHFSVIAFHVKGATPLMFTAMFGRLSGAKELLQGRADPSLHNSRRKTALDLAVIFQRPTA